MAIRKLLNAGLLMLLCGLTFDFRGGGVAGPSLVQYLFLAVSSIGGLSVIVSGLILSRGRIITGSRFGSFVLLITLAFCAWAPVALVASSDTAHNDFISVILPYLTYAQSLLAVLIALQSGTSERSLIRIMLVVAVLSCAWRMVYALTLGGVELSSARWQILSPALPLILGASVAALSTKTQRPLAIFGIAYFLGIVTLSITRGYLISLAAVLLATVLATRGRGSAMLAPRSLGRVAVVAISIALSLSVLALVLPPDVSQRWAGRLTGEKSQSGEEVTLLYRLAQFKGQYDELTRNAVSLLAGRGFGANFVFDELLLSSLSFLAANEVIESTNGSDSTWGYPIFAHGFVLGPLFLGAFLFSVLRSLNRCRESQLSGRAAFPQFVVCFSLMGFLGISLTGNIFGERLGGVLIGALIALLIWQTRDQRRYRISSSAPLPLRSGADLA